MIQPVYPSQWIKEVATSYACLILECQPYTFLYDLNYGKISLHVPNVIRPKWFQRINRTESVCKRNPSFSFIKAVSHEEENNTFCPRNKFHEHETPSTTLLTRPVVTRVYRSEKRADQIRVHFRCFLAYAWVNDSTRHLHIQTFAYFWLNVL